MALPQNSVVSHQESKSWLPHKVCLRAEAVLVADVADELVVDDWLALALVGPIEPVHQDDLLQHPQKALSFLFAEVLSEAWE
jgi:hypothetical protein